jgi:hypothetical protein
MSFKQILRRRRDSDVASGIPDIRVNRMLDELPLEAPSNGFTERVMKELERRERHGWTTSQLGPEQPSRWQRVMRAELSNGLIAAAATYFFIASGLIDRLISADVQQWSLKLASTVSEAAWAGEGVVRELSMWINQYLM